jgi:hypothetical protein
VEREEQSEPGEMWIRSFPRLVSIVHARFKDPRRLNGGHIFTHDCILAHIRMNSKGRSLKSYGRNGNRHRREKLLFLEKYHGFTTKMGLCLIVILVTQQNWR